MFGTVVVCTRTTSAAIERARFTPDAPLEEVSAGIDKADSVEAFV